MTVSHTIKLLHKEIEEIKYFVSVPSLQVPQKKEYPKLVIIRSKLFIGCHRVNEHYRPDHSFATPTYTIDGQEIQFAQLFSAFGEYLPPRHVMISGSAGMGKSFLLFSFAKAAVNAINGGENTVGLNHIKLVLYLKFKYIRNRETHLRDLLIGQQTPRLEEDKKHQLYKWMVENEGQNVMIILSGLDHFCDDLNADKELSEYYKRSLASSFIRDIFARRLFPKAVILSSSREHAIYKLEQYWLPDRIVAIEGLRGESIDRLIVELGGKDGEQIKADLKEHCPFVYSLCVNPLFLQYVVATQSQNPRDAIKTVTELIMHVITKFVISPFSARKININQVRLNLMKMAYRGTKAGKVLFRNKDLQNANLDINQLDDLVIIINEHKPGIQEHLKGRKLIFFSHQVLQEALSSLHIANMELNKFRSIVSTIFGDKRWSVVVRILCGIIMNVNVNETLELAIDDGIEEINEKREIVLKLVRDTFLKYKTIAQLEHLHILYECNLSHNQSVSLKLQGNQLKYYDVFCVSSIICHLKDVRELNLSSLLPTNSNTISSSQLKLMERVTRKNRQEV